MSALFKFLPYARRGAAASITGVVPVRGVMATKSVTPAVDGVAQPAVEHAFPILGPEHVGGLGPGQVLRMSPAPGSDSDSANYLAYIEFAHPDLPWMFSPAAPNGGQLTPWLNLIVLPQGKGLPRIEAGAPNPSIAVAVEALPDLAGSWAWAHVQVAIANEGDEVTPLLANPGNPMAISRLVSPRKLEPHRDYVACVVPTYELGRQAGLGQAIAALTEAEAREGKPLALAWAAADPAATVRLPVFHHWYFRTGPAGDFETLAQRLFPFYAPASEAGQRTVLLSPAVSRFPANAGFGAHVLSARTAIATRTEPGPFAPESNAGEPDRDKVNGAIKSLVNLAAERVLVDGRMRPVVGPPIYGRWHARKAAITHEAGQPASWLDEINLDPELRIAAAVGARVVRHDQEPLIEEAWRQLKSIEEANRRARWGQVFMAASLKLHETRLKNMKVDRLLQVTKPSLGRLRVEPELTVAGRLERTTLPTAMISANFTRSARFAVKALLREGQLATVERLGQGAVSDLLRGQSTLFDRRLSAPIYLQMPQFDELFAPEVKLRFDHYLTPDFRREVPDLPPIFASVRERVDTELRVRVDTPQEEVLRGRVRGPLRGRGEAFRPGVEVEGPGVGRVLIRRGGVGLHLGVGIAEQVGHAFELPQQQFAQIAADRFLVDNNVPFVLDEEGNQAGILLDAAQVDILANQIGVAEVTPIFAALQAAPARESFALLAAGLVVDEADRGAFVQRASVRRDLFSTINPGLDFSLSPILAGAEDIGALVVDMPASAAEVWASQKEQQAAQPHFRFESDTEASSQVLGLLEPTSRYQKMLAWAVPIAGDGLQIGQPRRRSPAHPIMFAPKFTDAMFQRLKRLDPNWILGHAEALPVNSVSIFSVNSRFVEALLVGANYEMGRELQWRRYPTDMMGTSFARFWSSLSDDILPIHEWERQLGSNNPRASADEDTILVIRGDLLRVYPGTLIGAVKGRVESRAEGKVFHLSADPDNRRPSTFRQKLHPDFTVVGLRVTMDKLSAPDEDRECWYIELTQPADEPRFGLDEQEGAADARPNSRKTMSWQNMAGQVRNGHLVVADGLPAFATIEGKDPGADGGRYGARWAADSDAAQIAALLYQAPFQVLLRARDYIEKGE